MSFAAARDPNYPAQSGFTIVELMVATLVFSIILLVISSGIIHFTEDYYRGIHQSATQTATRTIINTVSQNLEYGGGADAYFNSDLSSPNAVDKFICIGSVQIDYTLGRELGKSGNNYGVFVTTKPAAGCGPYTSLPATLVASGRELLAPSMRVTNLAVTNGPAAARSLYGVIAGVAYGDDDLLCDRDYTATDPGGCGPAAPVLPAGFDWKGHGASISCRTGNGTQFCAFSQLSTQVVARFESTSP